MNLEKRLRKNTPGYDESGESENSVLETLQKQISMDGIHKLRWYLEGAVKSDNGSDWRCGDNADFREKWVNM